MLPSVRAALAEAAQHDVVLGDLERDLIGHLLDRPLQAAVLEGLHPAAAPADRVMVMVPGRVDPLVARDPALDLEALHQAQLLQQVEGPVDAGATDVDLAPAQLLLELQRGHRAIVSGQRLDDDGPGAAATVARLAQHRQRVLGPCGVDGGGHLSRS